MDNIEIFTTIFMGIILFLFGLKNFSLEIEEVSGDKFRQFLSNATKNPYSSVLVGALITGIVQSSTASTVISLSLVNSGIISSLNSLGLVFGANIGSSITSQLVALKLTNFAPFFILGGFMLGLFKNKYTFLSKSIFYFGIVFFSLNLISQSVEPLKTNPWFIQALTDAQNPFFGLILGFVCTAIVNSSSVTVGILIILAQQNAIGIEQALPIVLGAKIGTTITTLIASIGMEAEAKRTAVAHFIFNFMGVFLFLPLLDYSSLLTLTASDPGQVVANALLFFNIITTVISLIFFKQFYKLLLKIVPEQENHYKSPLPSKEMKGTIVENFENITSEYIYCLFLFKEAYISSVIGLESSHETLIKKAKKINNILKYFTKENSDKIKILLHDIEKNENASLIVELYQLNLKLNGLIHLNEQFEVQLSYLENRNLRLSLDMIFSVREISQNVHRTITCLENYLTKKNGKQDVDDLISKYRQTITQENKTYLKRVLKNDITSGNFFIEFIDINNKIIYFLNDFRHVFDKVNSKFDKIKSVPHSTTSQDSVSSPI